MPKEPIVPSPSDGVPHEPSVQPASLPEGIPRIVGGSLEARPRNDFAAEAVLDKLNRGIVIFDPDACVHFLNDAAMRLLRESKAIDVIDSRLVFTEAECQERFVGYLRRCAERASSGMDRLWCQSLHPDKKAAGGGYRTGTGQRQAGHLPLPALPRAQAGS